MCSRNAEGVVTRKQLHDATVARLYDSLRAVVRGVVVLRDVLWAPHDVFPNYAHVFDLVLLGSRAAVTVVDESTGRVAIKGAVTVIDDDCEPEFYDKANLLYFTSVYEYVLFDPTGELMRPNFHAYRKDDLGFRPVRSCAAGTFFSTLQFRLDAEGAEIRVASSGRLHYEEELLKCRLAYKKKPTPQLAEKIQTLERKAMEPRPVDEDGDDEDGQ